VCKEFWLSRHAVWAQCTGKIIYYAFWCLLPPGDHCGEHVIPPLTFWDAMESIGYAMCTPAHH
ncbi:hypothetical protein C8R41DRAFT_720928, partial [Lentinula lateritia]